MTAGLLVDTMKGQKATSQRRRRRLAIRIRGCISPVTSHHCRLQRDEDGMEWNEEAPRAATRETTMLAWSPMACLGTYRLLLSNVSWPVCLFLYLIVRNDNEGLAGLVVCFSIAVLGLAQGDVTLSQWERRVQLASWTDLDTINASCSSSSARGAQAKTKSEF